MKNVAKACILLSIFAGGATIADPITWKHVPSTMNNSSFIPSGQGTAESSMPSYGANRGHQGSSGARYQYDLNNPVERNRYSIDLDAQRRDTMKINPGSLDELKGQQGGGYYGN